MSASEVKPTSDQPARKSANDPKRTLPSARLPEIMEYPDRATRPHSGFMPANFTTFAHFAVSSEMSLPKSAGEPASGVPPRSASCAFILGSATTELISLFNLSMISAHGDAPQTCAPSQAHHQY